jgi:diaminohydroxyphosphoribosylaminopyrimidine deaminase/5-amino-6-(5-phosphoribosylamino)uracil reductase
MSLDGKIATASGNSKWISSKGSRAWVHALRGKMDAIAVGSRTARLDDPLLTVRPPGPRTPVRVVLCGAPDLSLQSQLVKTAREAPVLVVSRRDATGEHADALRAAGCEVLPLAGLDDQAVVGQLLDELGRRRMTNILVEGGSALLGSFRDAGEIDEAHVFVAPCLIGGAGALAPIGGRGVEQVAEAMELNAWTFEQIDRDILIHGRRERDWRHGQNSS